MIRRFPIISALFAILASQLPAAGHEQSEAMLSQLNAKAPDWMKVGSPIRVQSVEEQAAAAVPPPLRPLSGESSSTRTKVTLPGYGIEITPKAPISYYYGSSLTPDGTKLILNLGSEIAAYKIEPGGRYYPMELHVPTVTYDEGPKAFIHGWSWIDNDILVANAEIDTDEGEFVENRIYFFDTKSGVLKRLDAGIMQDPTLSGLRILKVGENMDHLLVEQNGRQFLLKADMLAAFRKSDDAEREARGDGSAVGSSPSHGRKGGSLLPNQESWGGSGAGIWLPVAAVLLLALAIGYRLLRKRDQTRGL